MKYIKTNSFNTSDLAYGGFNLNNDVNHLNDDKDEEVREVRLMSRDKAKKKPSYSSVSSQSSATAPVAFVNMLVDQWKNVHSRLFFKEKEAHESFFKATTMKMEEKKFLHMQKEIEIQRQIFIFQQEK
ncbi:hypothetical protein Tco_0563507 [Tanacetum coccineum]